MTAMLASDAPPPPWYRQLWPWLLIAIPGVSVLLGILMITLASIGHDALVVDDWYKEGKAINRRIERDGVAVRRGLEARFARAPDGLVLELGARDGAFVPPAALDVRWVHVTRAERDGGATFRHAGGGRYVAPDARLPGDGRWRLHVEPAPADGAGAGDWRLVSETLRLAPDSAPAFGAAATPATDAAGRP